MKRIALMLVLAMGLTHAGLAADSVTVGTNGIVTWPTNFTTANAIVTNNQTDVTLNGTFSGNGIGLTGLVSSVTNLSLADLTDTMTINWIPVGDGTNLILTSPAGVRSALGLGGLAQSNLVDVSGLWDTNGTAQAATNGLSPLAWLAFPSSDTNIYGIRSNAWAVISSTGGSAYDDGWRADYEPWWSDLTNNLYATVAWATTNFDASGAAHDATNGLGAMAWMGLPASDTNFYGMRSNAWEVIAGIGSGATYTVLASAVDKTPGYLADKVIGTGDVQVTTIDLGGGVLARYVGLTSPLGALALISEVTSNYVDTATDTAYRNTGASGSTNLSDYNNDVPFLTVESDTNALVALGFHTNLQGGAHGITGLIQAATNGLMRTNNLTDGTVVSSLGSGASGGAYGVAIGAPSTAAGSAGAYGVAIGTPSTAAGYGVAIGQGASAGERAIAIGYVANAPSTGCISIGQSIVLTQPIGSNWINSCEIGTGTNMLEGGISYRGFPLIDSNGQLRTVGPVTNATSGNHTGTLDGTAAATVVSGAADGASYQGTLTGVAPINTTNQAGVISALSTNAGVVSWGVGTNQTAGASLTITAGTNIVVTTNGSERIINSTASGTGGGGTNIWEWWGSKIQPLGTLALAGGSTQSVSVANGAFVTFSLTSTPITITMPAPPTTNYSGSVWYSVTHAADAVARTCLWDSASFLLPGGVQPVLSQSTNNLDMLEFRWGPSGKYRLVNLIRALQ